MAGLALERRLRPQQEGLEADGDRVLLLELVDPNLADVAPGSNVITVDVYNACLGYRFHGVGHDWKCTGTLGLVAVAHVFSAA
jgi:hypothetical protein